MIARLKKSNIIDNLYSEEQFLDLSKMELLYAIRKLKALLESMEIGYITIDRINNDKQCFSEKYDIWFNQGEYEII